MAKRKPNRPDPVTAYAKAVVAGDIITGRLVRLACERHLKDIGDGKGRGLTFDREAAQHALDFFGFLQLDGNKPFMLQPWQQFIVGSLFGWKGEDGYRRYRTAYVEAGKGSGKSPLLGACGLYGLVADGENAAEIYSAATTREQAGIVFRDAKNMANASEHLHNFLKVDAYNIAFEPTLSFFRPVSSEHRGLDGKRVHMALIDEVHEHPTAMVVDKMRAGTKGRKQALIFEITNSGYDRKTVCWQHRDYSQKVLEGTLHDDSWFAYVCGLDVCEQCRGAGKDMPADGCPDCDDWRDPDVWLKANPNIGVSVTRKYLEEQVREATGMPTKANIVKRLNFCIWTESVTRAIPSDKWKLCGHGADPVEWRRQKLEELRGRPCVGGLDLGSVGDLSVLVLLFWQEEKPWPVLPFYWVPSESIRQRSSRDRVPYDLWAQHGFLIETEGERTDYEQIRRDLSGIGDGAATNDCLAFDYGIVELAVDRLFQGQQLCTQLLGDGLDVKAYGQGFYAMASPAKRLLEMVIGGEFDHGNNPVLAWQADNAATEQDPAGNIKFSKRKSTERIDGIVSLTMCIGLADLRADGADAGCKVYFAEH